MALIIGVPISWGIGGFCGTEDPEPRKIEAGGLGFFFFFEGSGRGIGDP